MVTMEQARSLDPMLPAAPVVVPRDPQRDAVGHGRTVPLVGGERPYLLEVVFDEDRQRVYADRMEDVLGVIIEGYAQHVAAVDDAASKGQDEQRGAIAEAFLARYDHADELRRVLQRRVNDQARLTGAWDRLDEEEQEQCALAASGDLQAMPPVGVLYEVPVDTPLDGVASVDLGFWSSREVKLCINRGDYGIFEDGLVEPQSWLETTDPDGRSYVIEGVWPANMTILDPTSDEAYLQSLVMAGLVSVTVIPSDLPDEVYEAALQAGRASGEGLN